MNKLIKSILSIFNFSTYLINSFPKYINSIYIFDNQLTILIDYKYISSFIHVLKNHLNTKFNILIDITAVDYPNKLKRFEINYILLSINYNFRIRVKIMVNEMTSINSISNIFPSAN